MKNVKVFLATFVLCFLFYGTFYAQPQSLSGFGNEIEVKNYSGDKPRLLQSFYFRFSSKDRHIQAIGQEPGFPTQDEIAFYFYDDTRNDEYYYYLAHEKFNVSGIQTGKIISVAKGSETRSINKPGNNFTFVLISFSFYFFGNDHHIDEIGVLENDGRLTAYYNDKNNDDLFRWEVEYAWVPNNAVLQTGRESGTRARGADSRNTFGNTVEGTRVIRGFKFNFEPYFTSGKDHHIKEIGVLLKSLSGNLEVYYSDKNGDDGFDWDVDWAILRPNINTVPPVFDLSLRASNLEQEKTKKAQLLEKLNRRDIITAKGN